MDKMIKIYVAGHNGMVGSAIAENLSSNGYKDLITADRKVLDLRNQQAAHRFMELEKPDLVIVAAARVGGIKANNDYPYQFLYDNLMMEANIIDAAHRNDVQNLIFLGSSCVYPKMAPQPLKEEYLLSGPLEPTNQWYAVAKIAGIQLCQALNRQYGRNYISLMPTNLYGPRDNFDLETSHVLPAMIRKFHDARENGNSPVTLWGSGTPKREFLHVRDLADAVRFLVETGMQMDTANADAGTTSGKDTDTQSGKHSRIPDDSTAGTDTPKGTTTGTDTPKGTTTGSDGIHTVDTAGKQQDRLPDLMNVGTGEDLSIRELALAVQQVTGHKGTIEWDESKPDGTPRKLMDVSVMQSLGWKAAIPLEEGLKSTYEWFAENRESVRELDINSSTA